MNKTRVIAVDFDNVIHDVDHPVTGRKMGPPMPGVQRGMRWLMDTFDEVVVFTVRGDRPEHVEEWLRYYGIPFSRVTNIKGDFVAIIDDKAIEFISWGSLVVPTA